MACALIALGSNIGDRGATLRAALAAIDSHPSIQLGSVSSFYQSSPAGGPAGQESYLNAAALLRTSLSPGQLLAKLQVIESQLGRKRGYRWDSRTIDLDLILVDDCILETESLTLPHPRMSFRRFVLEPAVEISPTMRHPAIGWTVMELLNHLNQADHYIAMGGPSGAGAEPLVAALQQWLGCPKVPDPHAVAKHESLVQTVLGASGSGRDAAIESIQWIHELSARSRWFPGSPTPDSSASGTTSVDRIPPPLVSHYWFDEIVVFVRALLSLRDCNSDWAEVDAWLKNTKKNILRPKLVVVLDAPDDSLWKNFAKTVTGLEDLLNRSEFEQLCQIVRGHAAQSGHGPMLRLNHLPLETMFAEVSAALNAMRPVTRR